MGLGRQTDRHIDRESERETERNDDMNKIKKVLFFIHNS